jgi:formate dehydrogenase iron-sulfur subunit
MRGVTDNSLGVDERGTTGDLNAFFLLVDKPEVYNLPEQPHVPQAQVLPSYLVTMATGALLGAATLLTLLLRRRAS